MIRYGTLRFQDSEPARVSFTVSGQRGELTPLGSAPYDILGRLVDAVDPVLLEEKHGTRWRGYIQVLMHIAPEGVYRCS